MQPEIDWDSIDDPLILARALWSEQGLQMVPKKFRELFERAYASAPNDECLWQLGGALNDVLRRHPGSIAIPQELPGKLLASRDADARIIGLKLLAQSGCSEEKLVQESVRAVEKRDNYESYGGLNQMHDLIDRCGRERRSLSAPVRMQIKNALAVLLSDPDEYTRESAKWCIQELAEPTS